MKSFFKNYPWVRIKKSNSNKKERKKERWKEGRKERKRKNGRKEGNEMQGLWTHSRPSESKCHFKVPRQFMSTSQLVSPGYCRTYLLSHHRASCCCSAVLVWDSSGSWATPLSHRSPTSFPLRAWHFNKSQSSWASKLP